MRSYFAVVNLERACRDFYSVLAHDESDIFVRCAYLGAVPLPIVSCFHFIRDHPRVCGEHENREILQMRFQICRGLDFKDLPQLDNILVSAR